MVWMYSLSYFSGLHKMNNTTSAIPPNITEIIRKLTQENKNNNEAGDATWILTSAFIIFTMQSGFGLLEAGTWFCFSKWSKLKLPKSASLLCQRRFPFKRNFVSNENFGHQENFLLNSKKLYLMKKYLSINLAVSMQNESLTDFFTIFCH